MRRRGSRSGILIWIRQHRVASGGFNTENTEEEHRGHRENGAPKTRLFPLRKISKDISCEIV